MLVLSGMRELSQTQEVAYWCHPLGSLLLNKTEDGHPKWVKCNAPPPPHENFSLVFFNMQIMVFKIHAVSQTMMLVILVLFASMILNSQASAKLYLTSWLLSVKWAVWIRWLLRSLLVQGISTVPCVNKDNFGHFPVWASLFSHYNCWSKNT